MSRADGLLALNYPTGSIESYKKLNIDIKKHVKSVLCLYEDDVENVYTALTIRSLDKDVFILSLLMKDVNRKKLELVGINHILYPQELVGLKARELVGKPAAFEVIHELRSEYTNVDVDEIMLTSRIVENFPTVGSLGNKKFRVIILGVFKGDSDKFYFNPLDETFLENGDYLLVVGYTLFIAEFEKSLQMRAKNV
jgi:voltage-gated potassium channel